MLRKASFAERLLGPFASKSPVNTWLYSSLKVAHILAMALWVGGPPIAVFGLRDALKTGSAVSRAFTQRLLAITPLFIAAALVTVASGAGLIAAAGGIAHVPAPVLLGAILSLPIFAIGGAMSRPALVKPNAHFAAGGDAAAADPLVRRFLLAHRLEQGLRLVVLVLMVMSMSRLDA
jgi:hypothetical protein